MSKELEALKKIRKLCGKEIVESCWLPNAIDYTKTITVNDYCDIIEKTLKEKETQDSVLKTLKEIIKFSVVLPYIKPNKDNDFNEVVSSVSINIQRVIENKERELLRQWVLETCFPKELKDLEEYKKCIDLKEANYVSTHKIIAVEEDTYKDLIKNSQALEIIKENIGLKMSVDEDLGCLYVPITKCFQPLEQNIVIVGYVKGKNNIDLVKEVLI